MDSKGFIAILFLLFFPLLKAQDSLYLYTVFHGENDQDQFGVVENVGDVNGDGFEDLVVGAPGAPRNLFSDPPTRGYAKLYYGGADFDTIPDMVFNYYGSFTTFGATTAGNGDLNGDGYSDFAIADPYYGDIQYRIVYVYFGGPELDTIPDLTFMRPVEYSSLHFGFSMTMSGDINGDGYDDLAVGAPIDAWDRHGEVFIYFGGEKMDNVSDVNLIYPKPLQEFGVNIEYITDVNEDYIDDLLISSNPIESDTTTFIFWGSKENDIGFNNFYTFNEPLGSTVSMLGDINGDSNNDFAVGNKIFLSPLENDVFSKLTILNKDSVSFGIRSGIPDFNGDGYDDFICLSTKGSEENILIVTGGNDASIKNAIVLKDPDNKTGFGRYVTSFSNIFGNNIVTLIIGDTETIYYSDHGTGKVFIYNTDSINSVSVDENQYQLTNFNISQNYPNPFNPLTAISYRLSAFSHVSLKVYDVLGNVAATLVNEEKPAGSYKISFDASELPSGVYFYQLKANKFIQSKKMLLLK